MPRAESEDFIAGVAGISVGHDGRSAPDGWTWTKLTDIAKLESGHTPSRKHPEYWDGDVPWISIPDARVHHGRVIKATEQNVSEKGLANSAARWLPKDTVCLSRTASVGYVTRLGRPMATSQDFVNWICGPALDPRFLMYALMAEGKHIREFGMGSTHTTIYFPAVLAFHVALPPIAEQRRIVDKVEELLTQVSNARDHLVIVPSLLKRCRQSILAAAYSGKLTEDWRAEHPNARTPPPPPLASHGPRGRRGANRSGADELLIDEEMPELPPSWVYRRLDQVAEPGTAVTYGIVLPGPEQQGGVPYVRQQDITDEGISLDDLRHTTNEIAGKHTRSELRGGDVLLCIIRNLRVAIVPKKLAGANITQGTVRIRPSSDQVLAPYLAHYLASPTAQHWMKRRYFGMDMPRINVEDARAVPVALPPLDEQAAIVDRLGRMLTEHASLSASVHRAQVLGDSLPQSVLAKALRGELVPTEAELAASEGRQYESAEQLLARVRAEAASAGDDRSKPSRSRARSAEPARARKRA